MGRNRKDSKEPMDYTTIEKVVKTICLVLVWVMIVSKGYIKVRSFNF